MEKNKKSFLDKSFKEVGIELVDKFLELVVTAEKPEMIERLTFSGLVSRARLLAEKYTNAVNCKCVIYKESKTRLFNVGVWVIDSSGKIISNERGMAQITMQTTALDDKLNGMLCDRPCINFMLELK